MLIHHQVELDDTDEADVLQHLPKCVEVINNEIEKGRGVLVHCQAGMSECRIGCDRSVSLRLWLLTMLARWSDGGRSEHDDCCGVFDVREWGWSGGSVGDGEEETTECAVRVLLDLGRTRHDLLICNLILRPNDGFLRQLDVFYQASFKVSRRDKATRMFYLERAVEEVVSAWFPLRGLPFWFGEFFLTRSVRFSFSFRDSCVLGSYFNTDTTRCDRSLSTYVGIRRRRRFSTRDGHVREIPSYAVRFCPAYSGWCEEED